MKKTAFWAFAIFMAALCFQSCSLERRKHLPGYHLDWGKANKNAERPSNTSKEISEPLPDNDYYSGFDNGQEISYEHPLEAEVKVALAAKATAQECDVILLKDGEEIKAKVVEITVDEVRFKRCDNLKGPVISIRKSEVFMITYVNGTKDVFKLEPEQPVSSGWPVPQKPREKNKMALVSFILACVSLALYPIGIVAFITGLIALSQFKRYPERYSGKWMAYVGTFVGLGMALITALYVAMFIAIL